MPTGSWVSFYPLGVVLGPKALAPVGLSLTVDKASHCPQFSPFLLKDQFFMVLVLIVFIVFKSVFLYVEGNNFLNTNR